MEEFVLHSQLAADTHFIKDLPLCRALLMNDARFPWLLLVPRRSGMREVIDLMPGDQQLLFKEITRVSGIMQNHFQAEKMNIAALGNMVPQLHIHIIARKSSDVAWPKPVWGQGEAVHYNAAELETLKAKVLKHI